MRVDWLDGEVNTDCPVCASHQAKEKLLTTAHFLEHHAPVTMLRCPDCGSAFLDDLSQPDYGRQAPEMLDYYVEQGAGIDLIVAPLLRFHGQSVQRYLEIGCAFGFALDFSRFTFGWNVLGVDPSPLATRGARELGVPILHDYFDRNLDVGAEPYDLVLLSEVLEHIPDPRPLLEGIAQRLSPEGVLTLSTPNAAIIGRHTEEGMLVRALSAGLHAILYTAGSLRLMLESAGFSSVIIDESAETLRACASRSPRAMARILPADEGALHQALRRWLGERARSAPPSALGCGFAYRYLKECVNAGLYQEAQEARVRLTAIDRALYGIDLDDPDRVPGAARLPFNIVPSLFFLGILELNANLDGERAAGYFAAAIAAAGRMSDSKLSFARFDGETQVLLLQSRKHLPMALAHIDPERALDELQALSAMAPGSDAVFEEARAQVFVRLVNAGAYKQASALTEALVEQLASSVPSTLQALDSAYCLGMLALHTGKPAEAAGWFARVAETAALLGARDDSAIVQRARAHQTLAAEMAAQGV